MAELRLQCPTFLVLLQATAGAADRAIVGNGATTWWEFKHATPTFDSPGNQELMCMRLALQGYCRYVIWQEARSGYGRRTLIVHPREVHTRASWKVVPEAFCVGYDHRWLVRYIQKVHRL
jgi:hypothetical protein